ncbi:MAG TPA: phosphoenolpyruvate synthase [Polyangia bacterium]
MSPAPYTIPFREVTLQDVARVGGKNASLGEMLRALTPAGVTVPDGFAITADAFRAHLAQRETDQRIAKALAGLDLRDVGRLASVAAEIRRWVSELPLPAELQQEILAAYGRLSSQYQERETDVAVRSSATAEDLPTASFAGQQETFLNVRGPSKLLAAVQDCMASLFTDRAIVYRAERGFDHDKIALSAGVQKMVRSDLGAAGVMFTLDTESGCRDVVVINAAYGLGETVVKGRVNPDEYWVHKPTLAQGHRPVIKRECGDKAVKLVYAAGGSAAVTEVRVPQGAREAFVLTSDEILQLARWAVVIERHYSEQSGHPTPMDIEWAKDGTGKLFVVQARPETVHSQTAADDLEVFRMKGKGTVLAHGKSVGAGVGVGKVRVVHTASELANFRDGEILVAPMTDPDWEPVLKHAAAVVTDHGGRTCHAAIVSRELRIPCIVGTGNATERLRTGTTVTVSCAEGDEGHVYEGTVPFARESIAVASLPEPRVPIMLNVGNPEMAFHVARLPSAGVGLARIEFIVSSWIGMHPMALLHPERVEDPAVRARIAARTARSSSPAEFFIDRLASGVAQIGAAFFPRPVIVRFSDFKTNEYAGLLGGAGFEPHEDNPMIGFRGASRYYDERYREAFALECAAIRRVREVMGLVNVKVMIPFCRTLQEARLVLGEMEKAGLRRGDKALEVYVMCEIPNNVILASEFADLFDGFSIGSNDLTQLTLGVDRDSALLAHVFDEADPGVKKLIEMVTREAHAKGKKVGLCGQAPSDRPEFAVFLAETGLDSISVTPDAFATVVTRLRR